MHWIPTSERVSLRLVIVVATMICATTIGMLLLFAISMGTGGGDSRAAVAQPASITLPHIMPPPAAAPNVSEANPAPSLRATSSASAADHAFAPPAAGGTTRGTFAAASTGTAKIPSARSTIANSSIKQYQGSPLDERLLFFPAKYPAGDWQPRGLRVDDAWFSSADGTRLHGWYCPSDKPTAVVLYLHGNGGNVTDAAALCRFFEKYVHATILALDYRGYGRSAGRPTVEGVVDDARAARSWLAKKAGVSESAVVLMGRSLGGAVAVQLTTDVTPRALVLENTFSSLRAMAEHHVPALSSLVPTDKLDSAALLARYDGPLLQCHAEGDRTVPFASGEELFRAAHGKKEFFRAEGLDHNDPLPGEYYGKLMEFLAALP